MRSLHPKSFAGVLRFASASLIATCIGVAPSYAAPFTNGGFELGTDPGSTFITLNSGSTAITGWTVGAGGVDYIGGYWQPAEGSRSLDLSAASAGATSQTFDTTSGTAYQVTFAMAGNSAGGNAIKTVNVAAASSSANFTFDTTGRSTTNMGWSDRVFTFTASATSTTLTFTSQEANAYGPALDNVRVAAITAAPEPGTIALLLVGTGAGVLVRRRRAA